MKSLWTVALLVAFTLSAGPALAAAPPSTDSVKVEKKGVQEDLKKVEKVGGELGAALDRSLNGDKARKPAKKKATRKGK